jgi:GNAT superfamily N-acetyltransferase
MNDDNEGGRLTALPVPLHKRPRSRHHRVPDGKLEVVTTYLEMTERTTRPQSPHPAEKIALLRAEEPSVSFYRYLYNTIGGPWLWYERRLMDDEALRRIIHDPQVEIFVLYVRGTPGGYVELDCRRNDDIEIAYFGLLPQHLGRGFGRYLLDWAVDEAWSKEPRRVWVHTCNLDHPKAIAAYQRAGFVPFKQETTLIDDPRLDGTIPTGGST